MLQEAYCSKEISELLREKGFLKGVNLKFIPNLAFYDNIGLYYNVAKWYDSLIQDEINFVVAPTHQMAMGWLREVHNIFIDVHLSFAEDPEAYPAVYYVYILDVKSGNSLLEKSAHIGELNPLMDVSNHNVPINFDSPEKAVEAALKYCLKNLICL